jgi:hypothetical protein
MIVMPVDVVFPILSVPVMTKVFIPPVRSAVLVHDAVHVIAPLFISSDETPFISFAVPVRVRDDPVTC